MLRGMGMIKFRLHILMGENRIKSIRQLSEATGINRLSLTKMYDGASQGIDIGTLDTLCNFFKCGVGDLLEHVKE